MTQNVRKVLIVDDDKIWLNLFSKLVSKYYNDIDKAATFEEALSKIEHNRDGYDLIVTDVRLQEEVGESYGGINLIERMAKAHLLKKCIVVTCYPSAETKRKAESLGAFYFVKGIFSREVFWEAVAGLEEAASIRSLENEKPWSVLSGFIKRTWKCLRRADGKSSTHNSCIEG